MINTYRISVIKRIKKYIVLLRWHAFALLILNVVFIPLSFVTPKLSQILIDEVFAKKSYEKFYIVAIGLALVFVLSTICDGVKLYLGNKLFNLFTLSLRQDILWKLFAMPYRDYEQKETGDLKMIVTDDVNRIGNFIDAQIVGYIIKIITTIISLWLLLRISWLMTVISVLVIPLVFLVDHLVGHGTQKINEKIRDLKGKYKTSTINALKYWREIKIQGAQNLFVDRFTAFLEKLAKLGITAMRFCAFHEVYSDFKSNYMSKILPYIIGAFFILDGKLSVGVLVMFTQYFSALFTDLDAINMKNVELKINRPYYERIFSTLEAATPHIGKERLKEGIASISFDHVSFCYDRKVLDHVSATFQRGRCYIIQGKSGCGKTTFIKILAGLYQADEGEVRYNQTRASALQMDSVFSHMGVVMQSSTFFNMSIRENLLMAKVDACERELFDVCRKVNLDELIENLDEGLDTVIGEQGVKLSGGQKQRLAIARVLLKNPEVIILDEATNAVDQISETVILDSLTACLPNAIIIIVTHKPFIELESPKIITIDQDGTVFGSRYSMTLSDIES